MSEFRPFIGKLDEQTAPNPQAAQFDPTQFTQFSEGRKFDPPFPLANPTRTPSQEFMRQLGLVGRMGINAATGIPQLAADLPTTFKNIAGATSQAFGGPSTPHEIGPSGRFQQALTRMGLPQTETPGEDIQQILGTIALGGRLDPLTKLLPTPIRGPAVLNEREQNLQRLSSAGYTPLPSQTGKSSLLEGLGGQGRLQHELQYPHQVITNKLARQAIDVPEKFPLNYESLDNLASTTAKAGYDPLRKIGNIRLDPKYHQGLVELKQELGMTSNNVPRAANTKVNEVIDDYLYKTVGKSPRITTMMTGKETVDHIKTLRADAKVLLNRSGDPGAAALGAAENRIANIIEDNIERNLQGATLTNFKAARTKIAKIKEIRESVLEGSDNVDASLLATHMNAGAKLTGPLKTIGLAGNLLKKSVAMPEGKVPFMDWQDRLFMGAGTTAGLSSGVLPPAALAIPLAGYPLLRHGMRSIVKNPAYQREFVQPGGLGLFGQPRVQAAVPGLYPPLFTANEE